MAALDTVEFPKSDAPMPAVLIVEDDAFLLLAISDYLQEHGFKTLEASNARDALDIMSESDIGIDLIFSDINMPGDMDGIGLAKWVHENRPDIPVWLASGETEKSQVSDQGSDKDWANDFFFPKPYDLRSVVSKIRHIVIGNRWRH